MLYPRSKFNSRAQIRSFIFAGLLSCTSFAGSLTGPRVSAQGRVEVLTPVKMVAPVYSAEARARHAQGVVALSALITADGKVTRLKPVGGPSELFSPAMDAVSQWVYEPAMFAGKPVSAPATIRINFRLER
jgi:TonB family protein